MCAPSSAWRILAAVVVTGLGGCTERVGASTVRERSVRVMGTSLSLKAYGDDANRLDAALTAAAAEIRRVEDLMTDWRSSPLETLNAAAGQGPQQVPPELARIIDRGLALGELTGGAFDITFAGVGRLWKFKPGVQRVPGKTEIEAALVTVGYDRVRVDLAKHTVDLPAGMRIGLGGIAKGYGVDRAMATLREHGVEHAIVNAGGDMKVLGRLAGETWEVAVKHPRDRERAIAVLKVSNTCVVTSGDYERFFERGGQRYHHILDPRNGYPAKGCMSATVLGPNAEYADSLATALCVLGPEAGLRLVARLPRIEAIVVDMAGKVHASEGCRGSLR